ncbi:MAG: alpha/beta hydrolase [Bacteroidota bacterium]
MKNTNLILLHGALGTKQEVQTLKKILSNHYTTYDLDFDGHGNGKQVDEFSMQSLAENVVDFCNQESIENAYFFGYSLGGYVALKLALSHPQLVKKIATFGTKFNWSKEATEGEIKKLNPETIKEKVPHFAQHLEQLQTNNNWEKLLHQTAQMMLGLANGEKLTEDELQSIDQEVLISIGTKDRMVSLEESQSTVNQLKNARLQVLEDFVHPLEKNDPNQLAEVIRQFFEF